MNLKYSVVMLLAAVIASRALAQDKKEDEPVTTADAKIKFNALLQIWNTTNFKSKDLGTDNFNTFRIRRAELKLSGTISENIGYGVMIDPAKILPNSLDKADSVKANKTQQVDNPKTKQSDFAILQDAYITYILDKKHTLRLQVGQTKYPLTYEGLQSSSKLNFIERAEFTRLFGDKRDLGIELTGKPNAQIEFAFMVLNGNSQNKTDINKNKDFAGRVIFKPAEGWSVGGSFYKGYNGNDGQTPQNRIGGEAVYSKEAITAVAEMIFAKDDRVFPKKLQKGAYAAFLYSWDDRWQSGIRYEYANRSFEQNFSVPQTRLTLGGNYFVEKNAKVQVNYIYGKFSKYNLHAATNTVMLNWQVSF